MKSLYVIFNKLNLLSSIKVFDDEIYIEITGPLDYYIDYDEILEKIDVFIQLLYNYNITFDINFSYEIFDIKEDFVIIIPICLIQIPIYKINELRTSFNNLMINITISNL